jgi:hypothetical protein
VQYFPQNTQSAWPKRNEGNGFPATRQILLELDNETVRPLFTNPEPFLPKLVLILKLFVKMNRYVESI